MPKYIHLRTPRSTLLSDSCYNIHRPASLDWLADCSTKIKIFSSSAQPSRSTLEIPSDIALILYLVLSICNILHAKFFLLAIWASTERIHEQITGCNVTSIIQLNRAPFKSSCFSRMYGNVISMRSKNALLRWCYVAVRMEKQHRIG